MKMMRKLQVRALVGGAVLAASTLLSVGGAAADPNDPICWMDPVIYCGVYENKVEGDPGLPECVNRVYWIQASDPYCFW